MKRIFVVVLIIALAVLPEPAQAQAQIGRTVGVSVGAMQFDLSGTGTAPAAALRFTLPLSRVVLFEAGTLVARPEQQFGSTTTFIVPEAAIQFQVPRRIAPYLGIGTGWAMDLRGDSQGGTVSRVTFSGAAGVRAAVSANAGITGELRVRGIGTGFGGSTAEWMVGGFWGI